MDQAEHHEYKEVMPTNLISCYLSHVLVVTGDPATTLHVMCSRCLWCEESGVTFLVNGAILCTACMSRGPGHVLFMFPSSFTG